ncbi:hypothetical protein ATANTOWER_029162 [Ataeniobius toweri]|uniref:Uncharacterized protein n=1 Tax=Ataeniobius toweri TaxID=208326 RepID=A0ABU7BVU0_9TELE|nr:hypothetical protein [Ataeniobius toweri]
MSSLLIFSKLKWALHFVPVHLYLHHTFLSHRFLYISIDTPCPLSSLHSFPHVLYLHFLYYLYLDFISVFLPQPVSLPHFLLMHNPHGGQDLSESTHRHKKKKTFLVKALRRKFSHLVLHWAEIC